MSITREIGQENVVKEYDEHGHILVLYATGFGKAKAALDAVSRSKSKRGLIITHSEVARDTTWPAEIAKWAPHLQDDMSELIICCYASLKSIPGGYDYDWVIADEAHYITPHNAKFFEYNNVKSVILLTATLPEDPIKVNLLMSICKGNSVKITLDDAIESGVLNDYRITVWKIKLTATEYQTYLNHCTAVRHAFSSNNQNFINMKLGERMRFIYNVESKLKAARYLRDEIRSTGKRNIIFCGSIDMADKLSPYRYHSKVSDAHYQQFLNGEINELVSLKQIQEGANIDNLEYALLVQLNSKQLNLVQKLGRLMRLPKDKVAKMHIIVVEDTVDADWAVKALKNLDKSKITHRRLERNLFEN